MIAWLREHGVQDGKPTHTLKKEFGSAVNAHGNIQAASAALRHADIGITAQFYTDKRERVTTGFGRHLKPTNVVPMEGWIFSVRGLFSVVIDNQTRNDVSPCSLRQDGFNLFNDDQAILPSMIRPVSDESRDYRWRLSITRDDWITLAGRPAAAVDYTNFKSEVAKRSDQQNKSGPYHETWAVMRGLQ